MRRMSLPDADGVYRCSRSVKIARHWLKHETFGHFCIALRKFERTLGDAVQDDYDYWKFFLRPLRRYRFECCAGPFPFNHPTVCPPKMVTSLRSGLSHCEMSYPDFAASAMELVDNINGLSNSGANPILDFLTELSTTDEQVKTALLLKESRLIPSVEKVLAVHERLRHVELVSPSQLRGPTCYPRLVVIGPARWFPPYVFSSPRSQAVHVVYYDWVKDSWKPEPVFIATPPQAADNAPSRSPIQERRPSEAEQISAEEILPTVDWNQITKGFSSPASTEETQEEVEAFLFLLEGGFAVCLDADASAMVIDFDEDEESWANRMAVKNIKADMFLLLRTEGGGDSIIPVADRIMGQEAAPARECQRNWKSRLRRAVRINGLFETSIHLLDLESEKADEGNVRNWMSDRTIKPRDYKDFSAIMKLVGLADKTLEYWNTMQVIDSAHRKAGRYIRKLLLKQVLSADLRKLEQLGKMEFELPQADGGSMTAFRVTGISPESMRVPASQIGHPFKLESESWRRSSPN